MNSLYQQVLDLFRLHQRRMRAVNRTYSKEIDSEQLFVLQELALDGVQPIADICSKLALDRNSVSRAIATLELSKFITSSTNKDDRRKRVFRPTRKAEELLKSVDNSNRAFIETHLANLSQEEIASLQRYQHQMADALDAPVVHLRVTEHPFQEGVRRVSRAFQFVGSSLFGSGHSSTSWQVLSLIDDHQGERTISELSDELGMTLSRLAQMLARFEGKNIVRKGKAKSDRRAKKVALTPKGEKLLEKINSSGREMLAKAFPENSKGEIQTFISILSKHLGQTSKLSNVLQDAITVTELQTDEERQAARAFLVFQLVLSGHYHELPERLISSTNRVYTLKEGKKLLGVCEIIKNDDQLTITNIVFSPQALETDIASGFLKYIIEVTLAADKNNRIVVNGGTLPIKMVEELISSFTKLLTIA